MDLKIKIGDQELTMDEAREIYVGLKQIFEPNMPVQYPVYPNYPAHPGIDTGYPPRDAWWQINLPGTPTYDTQTIGDGCLMGGFSDTN